MTDTDLELARRQRLSETWRASAPSREEIAELRSRLVRAPRRARRSRGKVVAVALVQGFFLGGATLAAAAWVATKTVWIEAARPSTKPPESGLRARVTAPANARAALHSPNEESSAAVSTEMAPAPPQTGDREGARGAYRGTIGARSAAHEPGKSLPHQSTGSPAAGNGVMPAETENLSAGGADGPWTRVAAALSAGDWHRADGVLHELESSADPATRDAAELTRAELSIAHGQESSQRPVVERLARTGATALIRKKAAGLLTRFPSR